MHINGPGSWFQIYNNHPGFKSIFIIKVSGSKFIFINLSSNFKLMIMVPGLRVKAKTSDSGSKFQISNY